jgi:ABC-type polysaccharide/polyol phosphate transport system ATPase subunit
MKSSSSSSRRILTVDQLTLKFFLETYHKSTFRDLFVNIFDPDHEVEKASQDPAEILVADDLSFTVNKGERVALIGSNGSGKTSLCRCIAGTYRPTSGRIAVQGSVRAIFDVALGIQPELTGRENAHLLSAFMYPYHHDRERLVAEALEFSELKHFLDVPYRTYSNGMQTRLCLSLASASPCDLLILDEVFEGADRFFREKISARMIQVIERSGACLFVSHNSDQIERVCNRAILLGHGKILFDGPVQQALQIYNSDRKAG